jgi:multidrug efflux system membrane fusion protein
MSEFTHSPMLRSRVAALLSALLVAAALGVGVLHWRSQARQAAPPAEAAPTSVPVSVAIAKREDVPVYLYGIGTAQPLNMVAVRARVDGTLTRFAVTEGQEVKQNELIAVIDPRPYQAALDAAIAKKSQDEAQLANSRQDLALTTRWRRKSSPRASKSIRSKLRSGSSPRRSKATRRPSRRRSSI